MFDSLFDEEYWRGRSLRSNMEGVRLEDPDEELEATYREAVDDIETFTGREFVEVPDLQVVAGDSPRQLFEDGVYFEDSNSIVLDPSNIERDAVSESGWKPLDFLGEKMSEFEEEDILLEELAHGIQDQHNGVTNYEHGPRENLKRWAGLENGSRQAEFASEGFADYVTGYLGKQNLEITGAAVKVSKMMKDQEEQQGWLTGKLSGRPEVGGMSLDHTTERYIGNLFYRALEHQEGHEAVMETALDSPPHYGNLGEVFQMIEGADISRDQEIYEFAKQHTKEKYGF
jgi:hypothetical protein